MEELPEVLVHTKSTPPARLVIWDLNPHTPLDRFYVVAEYQVTNVDRRAVLSHEERFRVETHNLGTGFLYRTCVWREPRGWTEVAEFPPEVAKDTLDAALAGWRILWEQGGRVKIPDLAWR